jgi:hypothetical protein
MIKAAEEHRILKQEARQIEQGADVHDVFADDE